MGKHFVHLLCHCKCTLLHIFHLGRKPVHFYSTCFHGHSHTVQQAHICLRSECSHHHRHNLHSSCLYILWDPVGLCRWQGILSHTVHSGYVMGTEPLENNSTGEFLGAANWLELCIAWSDSEPLCLVPVHRDMTVYKHQGF